MSLHAASAFSGGQDAAGAPAASAADQPVGRCLGCNYDLRGLDHNRCPECGLEFDPDSLLPPADIPWLRRGLRSPDAPLDAPDGGAAGFMAYWATVYLVLVHPRKLGTAVWSKVGVDGVETARFRWITIALATGSLGATVLPAMMPLTLGRLLMLPILAVPVVIFFRLATGRLDLIHFRADRYDDETRYRRLHELTCAGLALAPIVPVLSLLGLVLGRRTTPLAWTLAGVVALAWWYGSLRYAIHGGRCSRDDAILHAVLLPFAWLMIAGVIMLFGMGLSGLTIGVLQ